MLYMHPMGFELCSSPSHLKYHLTKVCCIGPLPSALKSTHSAKGIFACSGFGIGGFSFVPAAKIFRLSNCT